MANIILPERFSKKLAESQNLLGAVNLTLSTFGEILKNNKLYFFEEYTDHGIEHIQNVIKAADTLITDDTFDKVLNPEDVGYFILSVILHDLGMHISLDGLNMLLNGSFDKVRINDLDKLTWKEQWDDFLNEAKKYSGKQLKAIFGDENAFIRIPPLDNPGEINSNDRKLIGEFIRRYHPRLAHEIAVNGFPGDGKVIEFAKELSKDLVNITGLIARSHGLDLRKCNDYIETKFGKGARRVPKGVHATYLMVLLRLADYIQIDASRTSNVVLKTKRFSSPVSSKEHEAHLSIDNVDFRFQDDPERIFVQASPSDSVMYLKLKKLFNDIQYEFDISWAVLGELYGTITEKPEIKYRRISSNIEDENFIKQQKYVADSFSFKANDEVTRLLIAPLYGDDPKYGVRELLQNAVDACKERELIHRKSGNLDYVGKVAINISKEIDGYYFSIKDNGIGMTVDTIKNYFLSAGASYRKSLEWQKLFIDNNGGSSVRRSGRFGVGILAAFLIGSTITVRTRNVNSKSGFFFEANLNTDQINVVKTDEIDVGTIITIKLTEEVFEQFGEDQYHAEINNSSEIKWFEWYLFNKPITEYYFDGVKYESLYSMPDDEEYDAAGWNAIESKGYNKIMWTYDYFAYPDSMLACNGIIIKGREMYFNPYRLKTNLMIKRPTISVIDNNGTMPLSLDRNSLAGNLTFNDDLLIDIYKEFVAYVLTFKNPTQCFDDGINVREQTLQYSGVRNDYSYGIYNYGYGAYNTDPKYLLCNILVSKQGFILNTDYFINKLQGIDVIMIQVNDLQNSSTISLNVEDKFLLLLGNKINSIDDYTRAIEGNHFNSNTQRFMEINSTIHLNSEKFRFLFLGNRKRVTNWLKNKVKVLYEKDQWVCIAVDKPQKSVVTDELLATESNINFIREYLIKDIPVGDIIFNRVLTEYIGDNVIIPNSLEERKLKYPKAFKDLDRYMKKYLK